MAINSRNKRSGALLIGIPARASLPLADGEVDQYDRIQLVFMYPTAVTSTYTPDPDRTFAVPQDNLPFTISADTTRTIAIAMDTRTVTVPEEIA